MDDIKRKAALHIERVDKLRRQLAEVEEFQATLIEPFADNSFPFGSDIEIGIWNKEGMKYRVLLEQDLGITIIQEELRKKLIAELHIRKEVLEMTLNQLIGGNE